MVLFVIIACLSAIAGVLSLSSATAGVGIIALGCFFAVCARIAQAGQQHAALIAAVRDASAEPPVPAPTLTAGGQTISGIQMTE